jgi:hypothetical protein
MWPHVGYPSFLPFAWHDNLFLSPANTTLLRISAQDYITIGTHNSQPKPIIPTHTITLTWCILYNVTQIHLANTHLFAGHVAHRLAECTVRAAFHRNNGGQSVCRGSAWLADVTFRWAHDVRVSYLIIPYSYDHSASTCSIWATIINWINE